jgi:hypothetical protein
VNAEAASLPQVHLNRSQTIRLIVVGLLVCLALVRVVPDFVRLAYPHHIFGYRTDGDAVVIRVPPPPAPRTPNAVARAVEAVTTFVRGGKKAASAPVPVQAASDPIVLGDRVRIDRIQPFDRKPGLAGLPYSFDDPIRYLPVDRNGRERVLHLTSHVESDTVRFTDMLRIVLCIAAVMLGAMLFLVKPSIATAAFFVFTLAAVEAPASYLDILVTQPWRPVLPWIHDTMRGAVRPALLLFALCLIDGDADAPRERIFAWIAAFLALVLGTLNAYAQWALNYAALPAEQLDRALTDASYAVSTLTVIALVVAFVRAPHNDRHRISWIAAAFIFAGLARLLSDTLFPIGKISLWQNSLLVSCSIVPIATIWIAVIRHRFFNVDFVVSRAVVYVALTAAFFLTVSIFEELGTYFLINNTNIAYLVFSAVALAAGAFFGKIVEFLNYGVDRFIFRDRLQQRKALEFIAGYILDAETVEDVYRALLQDAAHALKLTFGGILGRQPDGSYKLVQSYDWPEAVTIKLGPDDELTRAITRTRGALTFSGKDTRLIQQSFPNEGLTFAAPLLFDRSVSGIVVYGHNVSGLDLDPEERELLVRVVAHASIALNTIELSRYRSASAAPAALPAPT